MYRLRVILPLALAAGAVAASPAAAAKSGTAGRGPVAHAAGGAVGPPVYPGLVNSRLVRTQKALDRAVDLADDGQTDKAISSLYTARLQVKLAWKAAKRVVETAPPPPVGGMARADGAPVAKAAAVADAYTTAGGVLEMQHAVAQTGIGMIDSAHGTFRDSLSKTIFTALDQRDLAVAYIHSIDVPPPPGDGLVARMSGAPVGGSWGTVMPGVGDQVDDEINQIEGALALSATMGTGIKRVLKDAEFQAIKTQRLVTTYWPPVVGDG
jgi:hypothetical protein